MAPRETRRAVLASGGVLAATALAGCSMLPGDGGTDPDEGRDSYGVHLRNGTEATQSVTVAAGPRGDDPTFERTVDVAAGGDHEWDEVLTGDGLFVVEASVDHDHFYPDAAQPSRTFTVGTENAPTVRDVLVEVLPERDGVTVGVRWDRA